MAFECRLQHLFSDISDIIESQDVKNAEAIIAKKFNDERAAAEARIAAAYNATAAARNQAYAEIARLKQLLSADGLTEVQKIKLENQLRDAETALQKASANNVFIDTDNFEQLTESQKKQVYAKLRC
jgi:hypothetical protein